MEDGAAGAVAQGMMVRVQDLNSCCSDIGTIWFGAVVLVRLADDEDGHFPRGLAVEILPAGAELHGKFSLHSHVHVLDVKGFQPADVARQVDGRNMNVGRTIRIFIYEADTHVWLLEDDLGNGAFDGWTQDVRRREATRDSIATGDGNTKVEAEEMSCG